MEGTEPIRFLVILAAADGTGEADCLITLDHLAPAYYIFKDSGAEVVLATLTGEYPRFSDLRHASSGNRDVQRFLDDRIARDELADTLVLEQIAIEDFDAAFCLGISGSIWNDDAKGPTAFLASLLSQGKPIAITPGISLDLKPNGAGDGLVIVGNTHDASLMAAHALLKIVVERRAARVGNTRQASD
jgi:putative intracellular protease/amidase